ncbi:transcription antitermination factor NusB [Bizionia argentinensis JUB59]|uniref:Transcription antitermination factor NusB n=1 Tax=Bizionia argentinensis JUB59 TaxID=1046627 RepID=G2EAW0_9FLAO|nr:transcription antitermination factor NusB [Bizionia argentinensis]EGV44312.2 transcription antitermination factor NusB [Bizionia argentinensis JUB59]
MLNRRHIRIKVMQTIYAYKGGEGGDFIDDQKFLLRSIDNMYNLYLLQLSLLIKLQERSEDYVFKTQNKLLATTADKDPNKKFSNNEVLVGLKNNIRLQDAFDNYRVTNWELDSEYVDVIFKSMLTSDLYTNYMETRTSTFAEDKNFIVDLFKDIIAPNDKLYDYLEDQSLTWTDDLPVVNTTLLKLLRKVKPSSAEAFFLPKLFKDEDDRSYALEIFKKTILKQNSLNETIALKTKNWDVERIARIDTVLLQMAICELNNFPSIPVKVTINEYLEIAKEYSTPKSSVFINGILDKLVKEYEEAETLNKVGRGLM